MKRKKRKPQHQATLRLIKGTFELQKQVQSLRLEVHGMRHQLINMAAGVVPERVQVRRPPRLPVVDSAS